MQQYYRCYNCNQSSFSYLKNLRHDISLIKDAVVHDGLTDVYNKIHMVVGD